MTTSTSPKTITLHIPNAQSSKDEEIAFLNKLTTALEGSQSYLETLFTPILFEEFCANVRDDAGTDVMSWVENLSAQHERADQLYHTALADVETANKERDAKNAELKRATDTIRTMDAEYENVVAQNSFLGVTVSDQRAEIAHLEDEIVHLKARLWDASQK